MINLFTTFSEFQFSWLHPNAVFDMELFYSSYKREDTDVLLRVDSRGSRLESRGSWSWPK